MAWNYWNLKFSDKATADSVLFDGSGNPLYLDLDILGMINGNYLVNIAAVGNLPSALEPYKIPFPAFPKRVFFTDKYGGMM